MRALHEQESNKLISDNSRTGKLVREGTRYVEQFWQVSPGPWLLDGPDFRIMRGEVELELSCSKSPGLRYRVAEGERGPYRGWFSRALNVIEPSPTLEHDPEKLADFSDKIMRQTKRNRARSIQSEWIAL